MRLKVKNLDQSKKHRETLLQEKMAGGALNLQRIKSTKIEWRTVEIMTLEPGPKNEEPTESEKEIKEVDEEEKNATEAEEEDLFDKGAPPQNTECQQMDQCVKNRLSDEGSENVEKSN